MNIVETDLENRFEKYRGVVLLSATKKAARQVVERLLLPLSEGRD